MVIFGLIIRGLVNLSISSTNCSFVAFILICFVNTNCICYGKKIHVLLADYSCHSFSCNKGVRIIISLFHGDPATRDCEMQSNKAALSSRNAPCLLCSTKVGVQLCRNTGYNLNVARRHLHVKGEHSRLCYPVRTRAVAI